MPATPWASLEQLPGLSALPSVWQALTHDNFPALKTLCLDTSPQPAVLFPCPRNCGCAHQIIPRHDLTAAVAACCCEPPVCPDINLTIEQATPLRVNRPRLGRAIAKALHCQSKPADLGLALTSQIASWSTAATPVILTIQY